MMREPHTLTLPQALAVSAAIDKVMRRQEGRINSRTGSLDASTVHELEKIRTGLERHQRDLEGLVREVRG